MLTSCLFQAHIDCHNRSPISGTRAVNDGRNHYTCKIMREVTHLWVGATGTMLATKRQGHMRPTSAAARQACDS
jgi:hypothetical protein